MQRKRQRGDAARVIVEVLRAEVCAKPPGTRLLPVGVLAARFGASLGTVLAALRELAREGWIVIRPRVGIFVADRSDGPESTRPASSPRSGTG